MSKNLAKVLRAHLARKELEQVASTPVKLKEDAEKKKEMCWLWEQLMGNDAREKDFFR